MQKRSKKSTTSQKMKSNFSTLFPNVFHLLLAGSLYIPIFQVISATLLTSPHGPPPLRAAHVHGLRCRGRAARCSRGAARAARTDANAWPGPEHPGARPGAWKFDCVSPDGYISIPSFLWLDEPWMANPTRNDFCVFLGGLGPHKSHVMLATSDQNLEDLLLVGLKIWHPVEDSAKSYIIFLEVGRRWFVDSVQISIPNWKAHLLSCCRGSYTPKSMQRVFRMSVGSVDRY